MCDGGLSVCEQCPHLIHLSFRVHTLPHLGVSELEFTVTLSFGIISLQYTHACLELFVVPL